MTLLRSALFMVWFVFITLVMGVVFLPLLVFPRRWSVLMARGWAHLVLGGLWLFCGIGKRVVGAPPTGAAIVAAKHMSMWDTLALYLALDDPGIILKESLLLVPFFGWYVWKTCAIPINRGAGAQALRAMRRAAEAVTNDGRPLLIFPEGTRKKPGAPPDYKPGVYGLYSLLAVDCVPVALDSGRFWTGFIKKPGVITLEFLQPIPGTPTLERRAFMQVLENRIQTATNRLLLS